MDVLVKRISLSVPSLCSTLLEAIRRASTGNYSMIPDHCSESTKSIHLILFHKEVWKGTHRGKSKEQEPFEAGRCPEKVVFLRCHRCHYQ